MAGDGGPGPKREVKLRKVLYIKETITRERYRIIVGNSQITIIDEVNETTLTVPIKHLPELTIIFQNILEIKENV